MALYWLDLILTVWFTFYMAYWTTTKVGYSGRVHRGLLIGLVCALALSWSSCAYAGPSPCERLTHRRVLPGGKEQQILGLLGPHARREPLPGGWRLDSTSIQPKTVKYRFTKGEHHFFLVLGWPSSQITARSKNFSICISDPRNHLGRGERQRLAPYLIELVKENDRGLDPWLLLSSTDWRGQPSTLPVKAGTDEQPWPLKRPLEMYFTPTYALQLLLGIGLLLVLLSWRSVVQLARRVPARDGGLLLGMMAVGAGLRLLGGIRVPGWINYHGFDMLSTMLLSPRRMVEDIDQHGNGYYAIHDLFFHVLPLSEGTLVGVQLALSVATIPLVYAVSRLWLGDRAAALWAGLVFAVLPPVVFYGLTEARMVPGTFFLLVAFVVLGMAIRLARPLLLFAAACWAVFASQCYPTMMIIPLLLFLFLMTQAGGRRLLRNPWTWAAAAVGLAMYFYPAIHYLQMLIYGSSEGVYGTGYFRSMRLEAVFLPSGEFSFNALGNVFLNYSFTPPLFALAAAVPFLFRGARRGRLWPLLSILACGVLLTLVNLLNGRMNAPRLQQAALPFYCLLTGVGLAWLTDRFVVLLRGRTIIAVGVTAAIVGAAVAIWPGQIGAIFTPQLERRVFQSGVSRIPAGCTVIGSRQVGNYFARLPAYLLTAGRNLRFMELVGKGIPPDLRQRSCLVYFRPAACFDRSHAIDPAALEPSFRGPLKSCVAFEQQFDLEPLYVRQVDARSDCRQEFLRRRFPIGFFRITKIRTASPEQNGQTSAGP